MPFKSQRQEDFLKINKPKIYKKWKKKYGDEEEPEEEDDKEEEDEETFDEAVKNIIQSLD
jgi:hypothetical protein